MYLDNWWIFPFSKRTQQRILLCEEAENHSFKQTNHNIMANNATEKKKKGLVFMADYIFYQVNAKTTKLCMNLVRKKGRTCTSASHLAQQQKTCIVLKTAENYP